MTDTQPRAADVASAGREKRPDLAEELAHLRVDVDDDSEPIVLREDGSVVDTWRQGYSYQERLRRDDYARVKRALQIELLKLQNWVKERRPEVAPASGYWSSAILTAGQFSSLGWRPRSRVRMGFQEHGRHAADGYGRLDPGLY